MESPAVTEATPVQSSVVAGAVSTPVFQLLLDLRLKYTPFNLPSHEAVIAKCRVLFPEDGDMVVRNLVRRDIRKYMISLTQPVSDVASHAVTFFVGLEEISIPLSEYVIAPRLCLSSR